MSLDEIPNGRIVMFAGGTGIHPYCDLIDLLYKETLVQQNQPLSNEIIGLNPLVKQRTLTERWKFCLYVAVHDTDDIHELTVFQLNHLSKSKTMEVLESQPPARGFQQILPRHRHHRQEVRPLRSRAGSAA